MLTHKGTGVLQSTRLTLRPYRVSDAADMYKNYAADARVTRFLCWEPYASPQAIVPFLEGCVQAYSQPDCYNWAMEYQGEMIGSISVTALDEGNAACEVGYCLGHDYWGQGLMTEALGLVIEFLFTQVHMHRIMAKHDVDNPGSGQVMRKAGMQYEGRMTGHYLRRDKSFGDALLYAIVRENYTGACE